jgi:hypothetical protein
MAAGLLSDLPENKFLNIKLNQLEVSKLTFSIEQIQSFFYEFFPKFFLIFQKYIFQLKTIDLQPFLLIKFILLTF